MADVKISQLPAATALASAEITPIVQSGVSKKATMALIGQAIGVTSGAGDPNAASPEGALYLRNDGTGDSASSLYLRNSGSWWPLVGASEAGPILPSGVFSQPAGAVVVAGNTLTDINNALAAAPVGGVVWIGARTISIGASTIALNKSVQLLGNGITSKITGTASLLSANSGGSNSIIRGIEFAGPGLTTGGKGIVLNGCSFLHIERCVIHDVAAAAIHGAATLTNSNISIIGNYLYNFGLSGTTGVAAIQSVGVSGSPNTYNDRWVIIGNMISQMVNKGQEVGIGLDQITNSVIDRNALIMSAYYGGANGGGDGISCTGHHLSITNNTVLGLDDCAGILLLSFPGTGMTMSDVYVASNTSTGTNVTLGQGIGISDDGGGGPSNVVIENNRISTCAFGIRSFDSGFTTAMTNIVIRNNDLAGNGATTSFIAGTNAVMQNNKLA